MEKNKTLPKTVFTFNTVPILMDNQIEVQDENGKFITLRYVKGEPSLNPKEQAEYRKKEKFPISTRRFATSDKNLITFLKSHPNFKEKPDGIEKHFWIEDKRAFAISDIESEERELEAKLKVKETAGVDLKASAYLLLGENAFTLSDEEIKAKLYKMAKQNSTQVLTAFDDEASKFKIFLAKALRDHIVEIPVGATSINWYNGKEIFSVEKGQNVFNEFAAYLNTKEGTGVQQEIGIRLQAKNPTLPHEDNLQDIKGIGQATAANLYTLGITSFKLLAETTDDEIKEKAKEKGIKLGTVNFTEFIELAKQKIAE